VPAGIFLPAKPFSNAHKIFLKHFLYKLSYKTRFIVHNSSWKGTFLPAFIFLTTLLARDHFLAKIFARLRKRLGTADLNDTKRKTDFPNFQTNLISLDD
jgi:hypothetical protein